MSREKKSLKVTTSPDRVSRLPATILFFETPVVLFEINKLDDTQEMSLGLVTLTSSMASGDRHAAWPVIATVLLNNIVLIFQKVSNNTLVKFIA